MLFDDGSVDVRAVVFDAKSFRASLVDQPNRGESLEAFGKAFAELQALLVVNGGYFRDDFEPAGLVIRDGQMIAPVSQASPLSAIVGVDAAGDLVLRRRDELTADLTSAIQAGPFIIEPGGHRGVTPEATPRAKRTILALTRNGELIVIHTSEISLWDACTLLHDLYGVFEVGQIDRAVNLDGGPSAAWIVRRGAAIERVDPIGPVRNWLVFQEKRPR